MSEAESAHLLPGQIMDAAAHRLTDPEANSHLGSCAECARSVEEWGKACAELQPAGTVSMSKDAKACPSIEDLANYGAGLADPTGPIASHVLGCQRCASIIRDAIEAGIESDPGTGLLLKTSGTEWRTRMVRTFTTAALPPKPSWRNYYKLAAAACIVLVAGSVFWWKQRRTSDPAVLLAQAYTVARPFEYRLPDAGYGRIRQNKGAYSAFDRPASLASAETEIQRRLSSHPEDFALLALKGRAQLLEGDYEGAIESLNRAQEANPGDLGITSDLAAAYAVRGDVEKRNMDRGHAVELLLQALKSQPANQRLLFNLALTYEKLSLIDDALETWNQLLRQNPPADWRSEAQTHLESLEKIKLEKKRADEETIHDPSRFLAAHSDGKDFDPLPYHEVFWQEWLPEAISAPAARGAAQVIAGLIQTRFHDASLAETIAGAESGPRDAALKLLAQAILDNYRGRSDSALLKAKEAADALDAAGLPAAALRARYELAYAYRWATRFRECAALAESIIKSAVDRYPWLTGLAHLEHSYCTNSLGEIGPASAESEHTRLELEKAGIWPVALRAQSFVVRQDIEAGNYAPVWDTAAQGLATYWRTSASFFRAQSFQISMEDAASTLGWRECAIVLYLAAIRSAHLAANWEIEAENRTDLAEVYHEKGDLAAQVLELRKTEQLLNSSDPADSGPKPALEHLRWLARLRRAEAEIALNHAPNVIHEVEDLAARAGGYESNDQIEAVQAEGIALLASGDWQSAETAFRKAVEFNQQQARSVSSWVKQIPVLEFAAKSYQSLAQIELLQKHNAAEALRVWRLFRPGQQPGGTGLTITMASLPVGVVVWKSDGQNVSARWVNVSTRDVKEAAEGFLRLCASPSSSQTEVRRLGNRLFQWLLVPELEPHGSGTVSILADSWMAAIPFGALTDNAGEYLFQNRAFVQSYGPNRRAKTNPDIINAQIPALIVSEPSALGLGTGHLPVLSAAEQEASDVASFLPNAVLLRSTTPDVIAAHAPAAGLFHFTGHGWANGGNGSLILSPSSEGEAQLLTSRNLARQDWSRCQLAVLSACLTATGEGHEAVNNQSLVQALLSAGAQTVVAARWSVDSEASRALMTSFYRNLSHGKRIPEALAEAASEIARQPGWEHPYFWAGFDVFGAS